MDTESGLPDSAFPACAPIRHVLKGEPADLRWKGQPVGIVVEGSPDSIEGRQVDYRPGTGGRSLSSTDRTGAFTANLSGMLIRGRPGERRVLKVLAQALRARGEDAAASFAGACDARGEDGLLSIDGRTVAVQVVSMPVDQSVSRELVTKGVAFREGNSDDAVRMVREALLHKEHKAAGTLLALDGAYMGAIVEPRLVEAYRDAHGDPAKEFSLLGVWIIGPTVRSSVCLGSRRQGPVAKSAGAAR